MRSMQRAGARVVEVGFPFSDPIADGPVIAAAMHEALTAGATPRMVMDEAASGTAVAIEIWIDDSLPAF